MGDQYHRLIDGEPNKISTFLQAEKSFIEIADKLTFDFEISHEFFWMKSVEITGREITC